MIAALARRSGQIPMQHTPGGNNAAPLSIPPDIIEYCQAGGLSKRLGWRFLRLIWMFMIYQDRMTAKMEGDFVVFLIGMRINNWLAIHRWLPVFLAMGKMLPELYKNPSLGFHWDQSKAKSCIAPDQ